MLNRDEGLWSKNERGEYLKEQTHEQFKLQYREGGEDGQERWEAGQGYVTSASWQYLQRSTTNGALEVRR